MIKIAIVGNIGCGKSTLIDNLKKDLEFLKFAIFDEPIKEWKEWLELFYKDQERWAFSFQMKILMSHLKIPQDKPLITERSPFTAKEIFTDMLYHEKKISDLEYKLYCDFYNLKSVWKPDFFIYLKTDPEICHKRINNRQRKSELNIPLEYIQKLHNYHENVFKNKTCYILDGNKSPDEIYSSFRKLCGLVLHKELEKNGIIIHCNEKDFRS